MKTKKIPMRTCVVTKEKCEKKDLLRIVRTPEGDAIVDITGKANGRGRRSARDCEHGNPFKDGRARLAHHNRKLYDFGYV